VYLDDENGTLELATVGEVGVFNLDVVTEDDVVGDFINVVAVVDDVVGVVVVTNLGRSFVVGELKSNDNRDLVNGENTKSYDVVGWKQVSEEVSGVHLPWRIDDCR